MSSVNLNDSTEAVDEYKETARCIEMSMDWLNDKDYARGKLDLVKTVIADLEKLSSEVK